jgi:Transcriptional regulator
MSTTRDRILDAAERLLARFGYKKTTMEDIAREAGLGKRTLYLHFASKEAVALSTIDRIVDRLTGQLRAVAAAVGPPEERLRDMLLRRVLVRFDSVRHYSHSLDELFESCGRRTWPGGRGTSRRGPGGCRPPGRRPAARGLRLR